MHFIVQEPSLPSSWWGSSPAASLNVTLFATKPLVLVSTAGCAQEEQLQAGAVILWGSCRAAPAGTHQQEKVGLILRAMPQLVTGTGQGAGLKLPGQASSGGGLNKLLLHMEDSKVPQPEPAQAQEQPSPGCAARGGVATRLLCEISAGLLSGSVAKPI